MKPTYPIISQDAPETLWDELSGLAGLHHRTYQRRAIVREIKEERAK